MQSEIMQPDALQNVRKELVLGIMPRGADPARVVAAGPWCFNGQEDFFPDWDEVFTFAPEPLRDLKYAERCARAAQTLCADSVPALGAGLCRQGKDLPADYWAVLLTPWAIEAAKQIVERQARVRALIEAFGHAPLHVRLLPEECSFSFEDENSFSLYGCLGQGFNHWLFSRLLEAQWPVAWTKEMLAPLHERHARELPADPKGRLRYLLRSIARRLMLRLPCPKLKGMSMGQALRFSLALLHKSSGEDKSRPLADFSSAPTAVRFDMPLDPLPLFRAALPESIKKLRHPQRIGRSAFAPFLRLVSVAAYEDSHYRQRLAVWRAKGNRLMYVQHGGNYGQIRVNCEFPLVEYNQHAFGTWGWSEHAGSRGNFIPLPYPQIARIAGCWNGQNSHNLLFVGTEMAMFGYRLDSQPTPLQMVQYREDKQWFFEALDRSLHSSAFYRPYFDLPGTLQDAVWLLPRFPRVRLCTGPLEPQILNCRLLVVDHHGTTMLQALAANVPTVLYWTRDVWPLTPESEALLDVLARVGIWHPTAEAAAAKCNEVWQDPSAWWQSAAVQAARRAYCALHAMMVKGSENSYWVETLSKL